MTKASLPSLLAERYGTAAADYREHYGASTIASEGLETYDGFTLR
jgi:hypothetical protein